MNLKDHIRSIPDFPKPGILFYDIATLLQHPEAWQATVDRLTEEIGPHEPDALSELNREVFGSSAIGFAAWDWVHDGTEARQTPG